MSEKRKIEVELPDDADEKKVREAVMREAPSAKINSRTPPASNPLEESELQYGTLED